MFEKMMSLILVPTHRIKSKTELNITISLMLVPNYHKTVQNKIMKKRELTMISLVQVLAYQINIYKE